MQEGGRKGARGSKGDAEVVRGAVSARGAARDRSARGADAGVGAQRVRGWVRGGASSSSTAAPPAAGRDPREPNGVATAARGSSSACAAAAPSMEAVMVVAAVAWLGLGLGVGLGLGLGLG